MSLVDRLRQQIGIADHVEEVLDFLGVVAIALAQQIGGSHGSHVFTSGLSLDLYPSIPAVRSE